MEELGDGNGVIRRLLREAARRRLESESWTQGACENLHKRHKSRNLTAQVLQATPSGETRLPSVRKKTSHKMGNKSKGTGTTDRALHPRPDLTYKRKQLLLIHSRVQTADF